MLDDDGTVARKSRPGFGRWLLAQAHRADAIGELAKAAALDRRFPKDGDAKAVSTHLNEQGADGEVHAALDDAELDWRCA